VATANVLDVSRHGHERSWRCYVYRDDDGNDEISFHDTKEEAMAMAVALVRLS